MLATYRQWNRRVRSLLWAVTVIGVLAALPLGFARHGVEQTSREVEFVFDYRDLVTISAYKARPQDFIRGELVKMKERGITTMAVYEGTFEELSWAGRLTVYSSAQAAALYGKPAPVNENFTYVLFADDASRKAIEPLIRKAFAPIQVAVRDWSFGGRAGLVLETPVENAAVRPMMPDPIALEQLKRAGFQILPRLSDRMRPYNAVEMEAMMRRFAELGVKRILFDGEQVTGFGDQAKLKSLDHLALLLKKYNIGVATIENISVPQFGLDKLAYLTDYNAARLYSLSEADSAALSPATISDRFVLAAKDRNIRLFFLNGSPIRSINKAGILDPLDNLYAAIGGSEDERGAVAKLADAGFKTGSAKPFEYDYAGWQKALRAVVAAGAIAIIALLVGTFAPALLLPALLLGLMGSAGLYLLDTALLEQALALGAAIAAPTLAVIWALSRVRAHTEGNRRTVGGWNEASTEAAAARSDRLFGGQWMFDGMPAGKRLISALGLYAVTAVISLMGAALVFGLLNNITYMLLLQQFRGVGLLALAPIALTALYVFLYTGRSVWDNFRKLLRLQITVLWVAAAAVIGVVGLYYLSRTGNTGQASSLELVFRNLLENTFGVRPRTKEFLIAHPLFLLGLFLSLRYRAAWVFMIIAAMGQLSIVGTFSHIHTPIAISLVRVLLGLGLGAIIGLCLIAVWQLAEGVWKAWTLRVTAKRSD
ncbi:hypothetical protein BG53_07995 [Paenibacillus darwinianus]|uniref:Uncharacterized protein n=1 Tax=Paenibacillus darwinianus TaxID=1380763 RepID=A0A9W5RZR8_9BACL|nr:DUF5693 family protein [Paenibacillus darwinianus]EXX85640.1 hypothetical protein BG53_07995 [Paenibacillus darwinianus]EXX85653.1 hypothetical protein CH50_09070 [Paenibacillus darwinianus]EXX88847.1 hypothetical protein BG52_00905 [Paenibacillus darwinianus]